MTTTLVKQTAFIQPPGNAPADVTSGMQKAANSGILGLTDTADGTLKAGANIGAAAAAGYYRVTTT